MGSNPASPTVELWHAHRTWARLVAVLFLVTVAGCSAKQDERVPEAEVDGAAEELASYLEELRGLELDQVPKVELLDDEQFEERTNVAGETNLDELQDLFVGLGLIAADDNLTELAGTAQAHNVVGEFQPGDEGGTILVRGTELNEETKSIIVHELSHAIDAQHFPPPDAMSADEQLVDTSLREGSAIWAQHRWERDTLGARLDSPWTENVEGVPVPVTQMLLAPYTYGEAYVTQRAELDPTLRSVFANPPRSTTQLLELDPGPDLSEEPLALEGATSEGTIDAVFADVLAQYWTGQGLAELGVAFGGGAWLSSGDGGQSCASVVIAAEPTAELSEGLLTNGIEDESQTVSLLQFVRCSG